MAQIELTQYRPFWRKRSQTTLTPEMKQLAKSARQEAKRLGRILRREFGAEKVYLFGSHAWGPEIRPDSDLDLAVTGLPPEQLVAAHVKLSDVSAYDIDLVLLERMTAVLQNRIRQSGILAA